MILVLGELIQNRAHGAGRVEIVEQLSQIWLRLFRARVVQCVDCGVSDLGVAVSRVDTSTGARGSNASQYRDGSPRWVLSRPPVELNGVQSRGIRRIRIPEKLLTLTPR